MASLVVDDADVQTHNNLRVLRKHNEAVWSNIETVPRAYLPWFLQKIRRLMRTWPDDDVDKVIKEAKRIHGAARRRRRRSER